MALPQPVTTANAPAPVSHFSQAQIYNGLVFCSGNIALDPQTNKLIGGTVTDHTVRLPIEYSFRRLPFSDRRNWRRYKLFAI